MKTIMGTPMVDPRKLGVNRGKSSAMGKGSLWTPVKAEGTVREGKLEETPGSTCQKKRVQREQ